MRLLSLFIVCLSLACGIYAPWGAFASPRKSVPKKSVPTELAPEESFTRLRADQPAVLFEERRGVRSIQYVSVEVKNVGENVAQHVEILAVPTVGPSYPLRGPKKLNRGQRAVYAGRVKLPVPSAASVRIVVRCGTCRR